MTSLGRSSTPDVITFDQNWHHLYSTSAGGRGLCNDARVRVISRMEPKICTEMLKKLSEKPTAKFPASTPGCSIVKIARLDDAFVEVFQPQASPVEGQSLQQKEKIRKKGNAKKNSKIEKVKGVVHFLVQNHARAQMSKNAILVARRTSCHVANAISTV